MKVWVASWLTTWKTKLTSQVQILAVRSLCNTALRKGKNPSPFSLGKGKIEQSEFSSLG